MNDYANFEKIINHIKNGEKFGKDNLSIWGGRCAEQDLVDKFLNKWNLTNMPYRIWEYVSEITFDKNSLPNQKETLLEHGRLFGSDGDLTIRRDGDEFRWHFIGEPYIKPPQDYQDNNFWDTYSDESFHKWEEKAMLWGEYAGTNEDNEHYWHDNRVARAKLTYPTNGNTWKRVMISYWTFSQAGQVQFVWFRGLNEWKKEEKNNGNR